MMQRLYLAAVLAVAFISSVSAECANGCNGHGKCTSYDMCICNRNWQASDCSERVCQFGLAHVDTPKGDLDMSGDIADADTPVVENSFNYPYGTTEMFPSMQDTDLSTQAQSAHYYMECSNKGTCDRGTGECDCFDGFDGAACQRASCPNSCSGHGVCKTIEALAKSDGDNIYKLWDRQSTMGCDCDAGYSGADCSARECKHGIDPLYFDDSSTVKYSIYNFVVAATDHDASSANSATLDTVFHDGTLPHTTNTGEWSIRFYDVHGEDWLTQPMKAGATCLEVVAALESLPNDVIPKDHTICTRAASDASGDWSSVTVNELDFDGDTSNDIFESALSTNGTALVVRKRPIVFKSAFWETTLPATFAAAMKGKSQDHTTAGPTEERFPGSYTDTATAKDVPIVGYVYRIKFYGNPGKLKEPEIEIYLDGKRPSILTQTGFTMITRVYSDGQQGESEDYFADHCDGVTATINKASLTTAFGPDFNTYHYLGLSDSEVALLKACLGSSDDDDTNNVETYNWDWGNAIFPHLIKLVRSTTVYTDGGYYVALVWKQDTIHKECKDLCGSGVQGAFVLVNPFKSLDTDGVTTGDTSFSYGTDLYDIYTTKGTLALATSQLKSQTLQTSTSGYQTGHYYGKTEAIFGFGSKEIIMTRPLTHTRTDSNSDNLHDTPVSASDGDNTGSVSCEHLTNVNNYYCLNKTDIFTLLAFDDGSTPTLGITSMGGGTDPGAANYVYSHFLANPPNLNLYSAEKLVVDRADYAVSDLFLTQTGASYEASTGLNKITTDISTNWAAPLIGATGYLVGKTRLASSSDADNVLTVAKANADCYEPTVSGNSNFVPQVGDIVSSASLPKGTYITAITQACVANSGGTDYNADGTGGTDGSIQLSAGGVITSEVFSFYRHPQFQIYKFIPAATSTYKYVSECSNRGTCDYANGICNCFPGYSSDACQTQNSLAV
jgi:hypothetical protein